MVRLRDIFFKKKSKISKSRTKEKPVSSKPEAKEKPSAKKSHILKKLFILFLGLILVFAILLYFGAFPFYKCDEEQCFYDSLSSCKPITYEKYQNSNFYIYKIHRSFGKECKITVKLEKMAIGSDLDLVTLLQGKGMICNIPKNNPDAIKKLNYCHGELKEGLQQVLIQRVYGLLIKDIPEILKQF